MNNFDDRDRKFVEGVWRKVHILEYQKIQEEIVKDNRRKILQKEIKRGALLLSIVILFTIPLLIIDRGGMASVTSTGFILLGSSILHEYLIDVESERRVICEG